jgi:hypothetical protein
MPYQSQPEAEEEPPRGDTTQRLRTIERWLHHVEDELLYAPDAQGETAATSLDARYSLRWGGGGLGVLAIERFPLDARHPLTQQPYGAYAVGEVFPVMYQGQRYQGRVIERLVSRAEAWWSSTCWPRQRRRTRRKASHGEQKEEPMSLSLNLYRQSEKDS